MKKKVYLIMLGIVVIINLLNILMVFDVMNIESKKIEVYIKEFVGDFELPCYECFKQDPHRYLKEMDDEYKPTYRYDIEYNTMTSDLKLWRRR